MTSSVTGANIDTAWPESGNFTTADGRANMAEIAAQFDEAGTELTALQTSVATKGTVNSVTAGSGLSGGTITDTGTIALADTAVTPGSYTYASLTVDQKGRLTAASSASISNQRIVANYSGSTAAPGETTLTAVLDSLTTTQGSIIYRNASSWSVLTPGTAGQVLQTGGASANPSWTSAGGTGTVTSVATGTGLTGGTITTTGTISVNTNGITDSLLRQGGALTVIGRSANSTGNVADIAAGSDGDVLRRSGTTLGFGSIPVTSVTNAAAKNATNDFGGNLQQNAGLQSYLEVTQSVSASTTTTIDVTLGQMILLSHGTNITTLSFTNVPSTSNRTFSITIERTKDNSATARSITWPSSFKWASGTAPTLTSTANAVDIITAYTRDGGTTWRAFSSLDSR